ncbi:hypothetical protein [Aliiroseovarius crassostreae]|uniref:hypothetical protein n=1 Tax=Aliiroseovarius crassostreae TaxID=154981 RepID=UPI0022086F93|nr:hypothetical protein [Aliiroseovarius crassostreae]UWQ04486.1 hypothetical protein K3X22_12610 [Aliiroseovarius crassostreae]
MVFAGLDDVPWATFEHAYGSAEDVPGLIRDLVSEDADRANAALDALYGNIWHQGTVYPASAPAVPYLIEALDHVSPDIQAALLTLLGDMSEGHGYYDVHRHYKWADEAMKASFVKDPDQQLREEKAVVRRTTLAVFEVADKAYHLLSCSNPAVQMAAAEVLTRLARCDQRDAAPDDRAEAYLGVRPEGTEQGAFADWWIGWVVDALDQGRSEIAPAVLLQILARLNCRSHPALQLDRAADAAPLERYVIVVFQAEQVLAEQPRLPLEFGALTKQMMAERDTLQADMKAVDWPWPLGATETLMSLVLSLPDDCIDDMAPLCIPLLTDPTLMFRYDLILSLILGGMRPNIPTDPCTLGPGRRQLALAFVEKPRNPGNFWFWARTNGNAAAACKRFGVPHSRAEWRQWLGESGILVRLFGRDV